MCDGFFFSANVRGNIATRHAANEDVRESAQDWFRNAKDRAEGGGMKRTIAAINRDRQHEEHSRGDVSVPGPP